MVYFKQTAQALEFFSGHMQLFTFPAKDLSNADVDISSGWTIHMLQMAPDGVVNENFMEDSVEAYATAITFGNGKLEMEFPGGWYVSTMHFLSGTYSLWITETATGIQSLLSYGAWKVTIPTT